MTDEQAALSPSKLAASRRFAIAGSSLGLMALVVGALDSSESLRTPTLIAGAAAFVLLLWAGVRAVVVSSDAEVSERGILLALLFTLLGVFTALSTLMLFSRGRQLRRGLKVLLPALAASERWTQLDVVAQPVDADLEAIAAQWRENGRNEHASVAAFAQLTLDLMSLGAPPALLVSTQRDALDEVHHAELCFSLAKSLDGKSQGPAPFREAKHTRALLPGRSLALAQVGVDALLEGALLEGYSARLISKVSARCLDAGIAGVLNELGADEGRHSRHGWDVVDWCVSEGGEPVVIALQGAVRALPTKSKPSASTRSASGAWERYGIPGATLEAETWAEARRYVVERVQEMKYQH